MNVREPQIQAPVRRGRGRPPLGDKRRQILDAALVLFAERGYHGTAVPLVASAAHVGTGTIYHYFTNKEELVNAVFRDAKTRLRDALFAGLDTARDSHTLFLDVWDRLARFAKSEPLCFRFLEMQDHIPYLDEESLALERKILVPLWVASSAIVGQRELPAEIMMALVWGALVGLVKSERLGYLSLTEDALQKAGEACWQGITAKLSN